MTKPPPQQPSRRRSRVTPATKRRARQQERDFEKALDAAFQTLLERNFDLALDAAIRSSGLPYYYALDLIRDQHHDALFNLVYDGLLEFWDDEVVPLAEELQGRGVNSPRP